MQYPKSPKANGIIRIIAKIKNIGQTAANGFSWILNKDDSGTNPYSANPLNLRSGESYDVDIGLKYNNPGTYHPTLVVDSGNAIIETNESNNEKSITIAVS